MKIIEMLSEWFSDDQGIKLGCVIILDCLTPLLILKSHVHMTIILCVGQELN